MRGNPIGFRVQRLNLSATVTYLHDINIQISLQTVMMGREVYELIAVVQDDRTSIKLNGSLWVCG